MIYMVVSLTMPYVPDPGPPALRPFCCRKLTSESTCALGLSLDVSGNMYTVVLRLCMDVRMIMVREKESVRTSAGEVILEYI